MFITVLALLLAATPVLSGRVTDSRGKPVPGATVRVQLEDGRSTQLTTDARGDFRVEANGRFRLEIRHDGYRTVRSSVLSLSSGSEDVYQTDDIQLLPGKPEDVESVVLQLEGVASSETRRDPTVRESLPK